VKKRRREAEGARGRGQGRGGERGEEREQPVRPGAGEEAGGGEPGRHGDACHGVFGLRGGGRVCPVRAVW